MKSFDLTMLDSGDKVTAKVKGAGMVEFDTIDVDYETILAIRKHFAKQMGQHGIDVERDVAATVVFELAVWLTQKVIVPTMSDDQASKLVSLTGGMNSGLVLQLTTRFGVSDILGSRDPDETEQEGLQEEYPT